MKALVVILLFFTFMGIGYALVTSRHISDDEFADWSIQDEQAVSNLPVCVKGKIPSGEWHRDNMKEWPCRIDLAK